MEDDKPPVQVTTSVQNIADLAVECWRLGKCLDAITDPRQKVALNHIHRKLTRFVDEAGMRVLDITGQPYDDGLALEVIETVEMGEIPVGSKVVGRMTSPIVFHGGHVIRHGIAPVYKSSGPSAQVEDRND